MPKLRMTPEQKLHQQRMGLREQTTRRIRMAMAANGVRNMKELAAAAGMTYDHLWRCMDGQLDWSAWDLFLLSEQLHIDNDGRAAMLTSTK